jgi:hypothetical protein
VVPLVAGNDVGQGADSDAVVVGNAASSPVVGVKVSEEANVRASEVLEFLDEFRQGKVVGTGMARVVVLVKSRHLGSGISAREPKRPARKMPLAVDEMPDHLPDAPGVGSVADEGNFLGDGAEAG